MLAYPIKVTKDDNGTFLVSVPDFPEVTTFGRDVKSAREHAIDAIEEAIAARMADREPIPEPSKGRHTVALPAQAAAKILVYRAMRHRGMSKNELARRLSVHRPQIDRLLNLRHATRLDAIEQALAVLGKRMKIAMEERKEG
jgi:antitoxin HicB